MKRVVQRKNYLLARNFFADPVAWDQDIDIDFHVDDMIVKCILYVEDKTQTATDYLTSNLVNYDPMCFISDSVVQHDPNLVFNIDRQVRGRYHFEVRQSNNAPSVATGRLMVILEFLQYEK